MMPDVLAVLIDFRYRRSRSILVGSTSAVGAFLEIEYGILPLLVIGACCDVVIPVGRPNNRLIIGSGNAKHSFTSSCVIAERFRFAGRLSGPQQGSSFDSSREKFLTSPSV
jgi:hypothetical protein